MSILIAGFIGFCIGAVIGVGILYAIAWLFPASPWR